MKIKTVKRIEERADVYCMTVEHTHNFALSNGVIAHNCCGSDFQKLLDEGFNGVNGRVGSRPPKHFREALYQLANYFGIMQAEWAGAQAVSSFDTYLAPYVFFDMVYEGLSEDDVKKAIRNFVYNVNVPSRWGQCVPESYKCLKADGTLASYKDLKVGDEIYVFDIETQSIKTDVVTHVNVYDAPEKMHKYHGFAGIEFYVTDNHRVVYKNGDKWDIAESSKLFNNGKIEIPSLFPDTTDYVDETVIKFTSIAVKVEGEEVDSPCEKVWCPTTNTGTFICLTDKGFMFITGNSPFTNVTIDWTVPQMMKDIAPTRGGENYFVSIINESNPDDLKDIKGARRGVLISAAHNRIADVDGIELDENEIWKQIKDNTNNIIFYQLTYKYFQKEMNIINRCFYEVLNEGDMLGIPFTFPIPTINITEDFDWEGENVDLLFESTAKYGYSYFQNFIGSQYMKDENGNKVRNPNAYSPNDVRSMCPLTLDTVVPTNNGMKMMKDLNEQTDRVFYNDVWYAFKRIDNVPEQDVYEITLDGFTSDGKAMVIRAGAEHLQPIYNNQTGSYIKKQIKNVSSYDYLPVERIVDMRAGREIIPDFRSVIRGRDQLFYVAIKSIRKIERQPLMCIEVANHEHNFTLASCIITSNCRLQLDKKQLRKRGGGLFGSDAKTGSVGVVTINMARLGYLHKGNEKALFDALDGLMEMAKSTLEKKREVVVDFLERGLYPYTRRYIGSFDTFFSTIGVNGMNEMVRNFTNDEYDITTPFGQEFAKKILGYIRDRLVIFQEETGNLYNLEATPAEGTMRRFAHLDKKKYPDILQAGNEETPFYTNSSQLPVDFTDDAFSALDLQDDLQCMYSGGTVMHLYMRERISSADACKRLVKSVLSNYRLPYISITPTFSICPKHGRLEGEQEYCPLCDQEIINRHAKEVDTNL